jgi:hypothetical protein
VFWGSLLVLLLLWGPGALSIDRWLMPRLRGRVASRSSMPGGPASRRISRAA